MSGALGSLDVLVLDCQAGGATPAHGDLLELGWARCLGSSALGPVQSRWIVPRTERRIGRAVRELTGWSEACLGESVDEHEAWSALHEDAGAVGVPAPTVIHFARFEIAFLRDLHDRLGNGAEFPLDAVCLHAVAARLLPDLPRRNIRALAGFLGHSPSLERRSAGHVQATAHIWHALVPRLEQAGVRSWDELKRWLASTAPSARPKRRVFPLAAERRRALPDRPGVYRFLRSNGDVLYIGKAVSLKKRVAGHFKASGDTTERALELLTQVHAIDHTETPTLLEAALLEVDEIKRLDPPYNVQLRSSDRRAWFASRDFYDAVPVADDDHRVGPLPSRRALAPLPALIELAQGAEPTPELRALALAVPVAFVPELELFVEAWRGFAADHLSAATPPARRALEAARALWLERGRAEPESASEDAAPDVWDLARVRRRLERNLVQTGLLARRARLLCVLADADVAFHERGAAGARALLLAQGRVAERRDLGDVRALERLPPRHLPPLDARRACFDIAAYDRLRVLLTELQRVRAEGGEVALRIGRRSFGGERLAGLLRPL